MYRQIGDSWGALLSVESTRWVGVFLSSGSPLLFAGHGRNLNGMHYYTGHLKMNALALNSRIRISRPLTGNESNPTRKVDRTPLHHQVQDSMVSLGRSSTVNLRACNQVAPSRRQGHLAMAYVRVPTKGHRDIQDSGAGFELTLSHITVLL